MSEFGNIMLGKQVQSMEVSPQFDAYSGVEIIVDDDSSFFAGNRTGRVLEIENPWGTQAQANAILNSLTSTGFQYQPYTASGALLNPAAEIGDAVTANNVYSGIYKLAKNYGPLMVSDIEAPQDEEIDHEYPYEPKQDRIYRREIAENKAQISINQNAITAEVTRASSAEGSLGTRITQTANAITSEVNRATAAEGTLNTKVTQTASAITAEVTRATNAEGTLSSRITQNADNISAKVSKSGGSSSSFGWTLTDSSWTLNSGSSTVFKATSAGIEVTGKITATSGFIGTKDNGFSISASSIAKGMTSLNDTTHDGVYIGTNGIALGKGSFKVTSSGSITLGNNFSVTSAGNVTANNMTLTGTLTVGGSTITAASLRQGAERANNGYSSWNSTSTTVGNNSGYWGNGGVAGNKFNNMADASAAYPLNASSFRVNGRQYVPTTISFYDYYQNLRTWTVLALATEY